MGVPLRILLISEWALIVAALVAGAKLKARLPQALRDWLGSKEARESTAAGIAYLVILATTFVASVGLYFFKEWALWLYVASTVLSSIPQQVPEIDHPVATSIEELSLLVAGAIAALGVVVVYSSP